MKYWREGRYIIILLLPVCFFSCVEQQDREEAVTELIHQKLDERVQAFSAVFLENCYERELQRAKETADSIVRNQVFLVPIDSLRKPPKPLKPQVPEFDVPDKKLPLRDSED